MVENRIPVIDLAPWQAGEKRSVADQVGRACENTGFLIVRNHGIPQTLIDRAFAVSRSFFDLPFDQKQRSMPENPVAPRGYHALGTRNLARTRGVVAPPDLREQFFIGPLADNSSRFAAIPEARLFYSGNIWPEQPAAYKDVFAETYAALEALAARLMRVFAVALSLPETWFDEKIDRHFSTCPSNNYPVLATNPLPKQIRCAAHTDFGSLTILAFNDAPGGLQAQMPDGSWQDVQAGPGQLVVNLGDMMQRWTNDRWKSTVHRVVNPPVGQSDTSRRQSIGFFLHPNYDAEIACIETCCSNADPARYRPIRAGDHMRAKLERGADRQDASN